MPYYEYRCNGCGEVFEKMLRFSETATIPTCPNCESPDTQKKLSRVVSFGTSSAGSTSSDSSSCGSRGGFS